MMDASWKYLNLGDFHAVKFLFGANIFHFVTFSPQPFPPTLYIFLLNGVYKFYNKITINSHSNQIPLSLLSFPLTSF